VTGSLVGPPRLARGAVSAYAEELRQHRVEDIRPVGDHRVPIYEYHCNKCGVDFEDLVSVADRDAPRECPACGAKDSTRKVSVFASPGSGAGSCGSTKGFT